MFECLSEESCLKALSDLLKSGNLSVGEGEILNSAYQALKADKPLSQVILRLKMALSALAVTGQLSSEVLVFFTEISRCHPTCGPSSVWNALIRKRKNPNKE